MPGVVRDRPPMETDDDHDDGDDGSSAGDYTHALAEAAPGLPHSNKRLRLDASHNLGGSGHQDDSWFLSPPGTGRAVQRSRSTAEPHQGDPANSSSAATNRSLRPGQIVRVSLERFVTYTAATFHPGPSLNMVIGPNGTGKSTLVCAISIGLGWSLGLLGRTKEPGEFVKHGCSQATIEIELKGHGGEKNPVVRREIFRDTNKSQFYLDGRQTTLKEIKKINQSFNIQIDNLCQFLPQERVAEFSGQTPKGCLKSTLEAAAPRHMLEWHNQLEQLRADQVSSMGQRKALTNSLNNLENRQNMQRADVERIRERAEVVENIRLLEKIRPFSQYHVARIRHQESRRTALSLNVEQQNLERIQGPAMKARENKSNYESRINETLAQRERHFNQSRQMVEKMGRDQKDTGKKIDDLERQKESCKSSIKQIKSDISRQQGQIIDLENRQKGQPPEFDVAAANEKLRELKRHGHNLQQEIRERIEDGSKLVRGIEDREAQIASAKKSIEELQTQSGRQMSKLQSVLPDTAKAWDWIQNNRDQFHGEVFGPAIVECSLKNPPEAGMMESLFQLSTLSAITCTNKRDFAFLSDKLRNQLNLGRVTLRTPGFELNDPRNKPPLDWDDMRQLGISSWALDHIEGPDPVLAMLCSEENIFATGVIDSECSDEQFRVLENSKVSRWVTKKYTYHVKKRMDYGPIAKSTNVRNVRAARFWDVNAVDSTRENSLREKIQELRGEIETLALDKARRKERADELRGRRDENAQEQVRWSRISFDKQELIIFRGTESVRSQRLSASHLPSMQYLKDLVRKSVFLMSNIDPRLDTLRSSLEEMNRQQGRNLDYIRSLDQELGDLKIKRSETVVNRARLIETMRGMYEIWIQAKVALIEATSDCETLRTENGVMEKELEDKKSQAKEAIAESRRLKKEATNISRQVEKIKNVENDVTEFYGSLSVEEKSRTPDELNVEIESQRARLDLLQEGNPRAIQEFEDRAHKIERLHRDVAELGDAISGTQQEIDEIRARWEPEMDELIGRISNGFAANFEKIGCAGEVVLYKATRNDNDIRGSEMDTYTAPVEGNDFENWEIRIMVKFRAGEQFSQLDSQRQSGGERAVSTIFYLMALQRMNRAPFRVVDEINQGMDPRNERKVHELMVDMACGARGDTSQYFLVTPKLLEGLKYAPGMTVHCIASGEFMPRLKNEKDLDFKALVQKARTLKEQRARISAGGSRIDDGARTILAAT